MREGPMKPVSLFFLLSLGRVEARARRGPNNDAIQLFSPATLSPLYRHPRASTRGRARLP